jgi:hypothetical protein
MPRAGVRAFGPDKEPQFLERIVANVVLFFSLVGGVPSKIESTYHGVGPVPEGWRCV